MLIGAIKDIASGDLFALIEIVLLFIVVLVSLTVHEVAHGAVSYALGDPTAKSMGRLSLNPLHHLDFFGTLCMLLFGYGWAKPVPVNPAYYKKRKLGMALTAFAGPLSNLVIAFITLFAYYVLNIFCAGLLNEITLTTLSLLLELFFSHNIALAVFNLIPIPPLDGSRILNIVLPERLYFKVMQYERYINVAVILMLFTGILDVPLHYACNLVLFIFNTIISIFPFMRF